MFTNKEQVKNMIKRNHNYVYDDRLTLNELIEHVEQQYNYNIKDYAYDTVLYSSTEPIEQLTYYESEHQQLTVTFIEDKLNGLIPHISNNNNVSTETFLNEKFIIEDERHMYLYDNTVFKSGELIYKYTDGIQHTNSIDVSLDCLIDDIFQHVHPERLKVYYKYDGQELKLFNGKQLSLVNKVKGNKELEIEEPPTLCLEQDDYTTKPMTEKEFTTTKDKNIKEVQNFYLYAFILVVAYFIITAIIGFVFHF